MKVLFVAPNKLEQTESQYNAQIQFEDALWQRDDMEVKKEISNPNILNTFLKYEPDLIIYYSPFLHDIENYSFLPSCDYKTLAFHIEDPFAYHICNKYSAKYFKWIVTNSLSCMEQYRSMGIKSICFPEHSINPTFHKLYDKKCLDKKYISDVVSIGYPYYERKQIIKLLRAIVQGYHIKIIGEEWDESLKNNNFDIIPQRVSTDEMMKYYCGAKIILALNRVLFGQPEVIADIPGRGFIETYSKTLTMIDDNRPKIKDFFLDREEIIIFNSKNIIEQILYYLKNENEREIIANKGHLRSLNYTYDKRIGKMFYCFENNIDGIIII